MLRSTSGRVVVLAFVGAVELMLRRRPVSRTLTLTPSAAAAESVHAGANGALDHRSDLGVGVDGDAMQDQSVAGGHDGAGGV